jgi:ATP phosphoribosyltransferase
MKKIKIALPKGRMVKKAYDIFASFGYTSPQLDDEFAKRAELKNKIAQLGDGFGDIRVDMTKLNTNAYQGENASFIIPKSSDLAGYVDEGTAYMGILGKDSKDEYEFKNGMRTGRGYTSSKIDARFELSKMRFSLIGKESKYRQFLDMLKSNDYIKLATSYPEQAKAFMARTFPEFRSEFLDLITFDGETELGVKTDRADIGFEIVESGNSLLKNGLVEYAPEKLSTPISVCLITNNVACELDDRIAELKDQISAR